ncbi:MAG TPA: hypothetical protein VJN96_02760 [Vicinamibacterales bacterium]|nr:hypothetical protein [Vicinamibacterales bacterium]
MGRIATWSLVGVLTVSGGCASSGEMVIDVHAASEQTRASIGDWTRLYRVPAGTDVLVDVDDSDVRFGKISSISDGGLTLTGASMIPRTSISQVRRTQSLSKLRAGKGGAIGFGIGLFALVVTGGVVWQPLVAYPLVGAGIGSGSAIGVTRQTVLYQRK